MSCRSPCALMALAASLLASVGARGDDVPGGLKLGDGVQLNAQIEAGVSLEPLREDGNINWGRLLNDRNNQPLLNQLLLTLHRDLDPKSTDFQLGFQLQGLYGSDARYTHYLGELDTTLTGREQLDIVQANVQLHLPVLGAGGVDLTLGQFLSPLGYEQIDNSKDPFYSHSYIFNFAAPFKATGVLGQWHVSPALMLSLEVDTGANTTFGRGYGDANGAAAGLAAVQLSLLGDQLVIQGLSHFGPENPSSMVSNADSQWRIYNDLVVTYKPAGRWSYVAEAAWVRDAYGTAGRGTNAGGAAQYVGYALSDTITLNERAEIFRDDSGFFVAAYPGNLDYVRSELGQPNGAISAGPATYTEITLGLTWKPGGLPAPLAGLLIRPEARYDATLSNARPYQGGLNRDSVTFASDLVLQF